MNNIIHHMTGYNDNHYRLHTCIRCIEQIHDIGTLYKYCSVQRGGQYLIHTLSSSTTQLICSLCIPYASGTNLAVRENTAYDHYSQLGLMLRGVLHKGLIFNNVLQGVNSQSCIQGVNNSHAPHSSPSAVIFLTSFSTSRIST